MSVTDALFDLQRISSLAEESWDGFWGALSSGSSDPSYSWRVLR
jgi:hypothetical protein